MKKLRYLIVCFTQCFLHVLRACCNFESKQVISISLDYMQSTFTKNPIWSCVVVLLSSILRFTQLYLQSARSSTFAVLARAISLVYAKHIHEQPHMKDYLLRQATWDLSIGSSSVHRAV